jgi:hypothetical protein
VLDQEAPLADELGRLDRDDARLDGLEPLILRQSHDDVLVLVGLLLLGARLLLDQQVLDRFDLRDGGVRRIDRFGRLTRDDGFVEIGLGGLVVFEIVLLDSLLLDRFVRVLHRALHLIHLRSVTASIARGLYCRRVTMQPRSAPQRSRAAIHSRPRGRSREEPAGRRSKAYPERGRTGK